jgi:hypothetical protein
MKDFHNGPQVQQQRRENERQVFAVRNFGYIQEEPDDNGK